MPPSYMVPLVLKDVPFIPRRRGSKYGVMTGAEKLRVAWLLERISIMA